jgi:hypothetical protein
MPLCNPSIQVSGMTDLIPIASAGFQAIEGEIDGFDSVKTTDTNLT